MNGADILNAIQEKERTEDCEVTRNTHQGPDCFSLRWNMV